MDGIQTHLSERIFKVKKDFFGKGGLIKKGGRMRKEGKEGMGELDKEANRIIEKVPDLRIEKVKEVKKKILEENYIRRINDDLLIERMVRSSIFSRDLSDREGFKN